MRRCYVGRCKCGSIVAATVDDLDRKNEVAKNVAEFIKGGLSIEQMDVEHVRVTLQSCKCPKEKPNRQEILL